MQLIDTHTHIYLPEFDEDRDACLERAAANGVAQLFLPAIDASTHAQMLAVEEKYPACRAMMGLHPCSVGERVAEELALVERYLGERPFIAIGEIGLDFYWDTSFSEQQYLAFHTQIEWALHYQLPIVIHSRQATDECIEVVRQHPGVRGVFHCFSGNAEQARKIIDLGLLLGIGGVVSFKNSGLDKVVEAVGLEQVVLETDAPYLAPVPYRGKRNEPAYTRLVAEKLAAICALPVEEVAALTTKNAKNLFGT